MPDRLPDFLDPVAFAEKNRHVRGEFALSQMDRLADALMVRQGFVTVDLQFGKDGRMSCIRGCVEASLVLQCQCCLEPLPWVVRSDVNLGVVATVDEALLLPDSIDPLLVRAGTEVSLIDIVQDELLLGIPVIPQHQDCNFSTPAIAVPERPHPFAGLAQLKIK